jgi:hypothetical protein
MSSIDNLDIKALKDSKFSKEPVLYCKKCLSLRIRDIPGLEDSIYCDSCGSTDISECSIEKWKVLYKEKYGHDYLDSF